MQEQHKNMNLAREFVYRLQNTCYNHTTIQLINAMAQNTNMKNQMYYGGLLALQRQTHMGLSTIKSQIRILKNDGLIKSIFDKNYLYKEHKRQNYQLILPPVGLLNCSEWGIHAKHPHHLDSFQCFVEKLEFYRREEERLAKLQEPCTPPQWD